MDDVDRASNHIERAMEEYRKRQADKPKYAPRLTSECSECGDEIEQARIKVMPHATRCIECENFHQLTLKRNSSI